MRPRSSGGARSRATVKPRATGRAEPAGHCCICGEPTGGARYCYAHQDLLELDPLAPVQIDRALLHRARRYHGLLGQMLETLEARAREL